MVFDLKLGFTCNNNCVHCVVAPKKGTRDLTTEEAKNIIDSIPKDTVVVLTGGEPTIRKDILQILKYCYEKKHRIILQTNGAMFSSKKFALRAGKYLSLAVVALHSHIPEVHDRIVQREGMCENTKKGLKNLYEMGVIVRTQTVISRHNMNYLPETFDFVQEVIPGARMQLTYPHPNGNAYSKEVVPKFSELKESTNKILSKYAGLVLTEAIPICYLYPYRDDILVNMDDAILNQDTMGFDRFLNKGENAVDIIDDYSFLLKKEKRKASVCVECIFNERCVGVWKEYIEFFGEELDLFPIKE